ncbi:hypothetical protein ACWOE8_07075 [Enterococcus avium]
MRNDIKLSDDTEVGIKTNRFGTVEKEAREKKPIEIKQKKEKKKRKIRETKKPKAITLYPTEERLGEEVTDELGYKSFSEMVGQLIREKAKELEVELDDD